LVDGPVLKMPPSAMSNSVASSALGSASASSAATPLVPANLSPVPSSVEPELAASWVAVPSGTSGSAGGGAALARVGRTTRLIAKASGHAGNVRVVCCIVRVVLGGGRDDQAA
jgi:hypothetical protein